MFDIAFDVFKVYYNEFSELCEKYLEEQYPDLIYLGFNLYQDGVSIMYSKKNMKLKTNMVFAKVEDILKK